MRPFFFLILIAGIGNTVLRLEMENPYTLYRLLAPLGLVAVFALRPLLVLKSAAVFTLFFIYNFTLASLYSSNYSQFFPSIIHYLYIFILLIMIIYLKSIKIDFSGSFIRFIGWFYLFLLLNLMLELMIGPYYPNLYMDDSGDGSLRAFFWNQNDLAIVLCIVGWFALALDRFKGTLRVTIVVLTIAILFYNDSKAALISFVFVSIPVFITFWGVQFMRLSRQFWYAIGGSIVTFSIALLVTVSDIEIGFANEAYTMGDLLLKPVLNIIHLESSGEEWGSLNNRTDAAIFVLIEYLRTFGLGLGAGGSWLVLTLPYYELRGAQSPHNALLQFTVDFGYPVLLGYMYAIYWALRRLFTKNALESDRLKVIAILSFPLLGLSQSGAIVTNYFFWATIFYIWLLDRPVPFSNSRVTRRKEALRPVSVASAVNAETESRDAAQL